jgi:hypothetical protein
VSICSLIEVVGLSVAAALAFWGQPRRVPFYRALVSSFKRLAQRELLSTLLVGIVAFAASAALSLLVFQPEPFIHDEFSYLLAADTFANGRLANPPHPMWEHFETFHVIQQPTYASKYPPAQGLMLAAGQVVFGHPLSGVWLSVGLCGAAICWMLQAWLPAHWALAGALLAMSRIVLLGPWVTIGYWSQSYWGGAVAALGGALVFGALPRILREHLPRHALIMALGLAILANSRPFEGAVAGTVAVLMLILRFISRSGVPLRSLLRRVVLPLCVMLIVTAALMGYYNAAVTGHPLRMPYQVHESAYAVAPAFLWERLRHEPEYHHAIMQRFWTGWACEGYLRQRSFAGLLEETGIKISTLWQFFLGLTLTVPLAALGAALRDRWTRLAALTCALVLAALSVETGVAPHYAAPITGLVYLLVIQSVRRLRLWRWQGRPTGRILARLLVAVYFAAIVWAVIYATPRYDPHLWFRERARIVHELSQVPGEHLIIVRYSPEHNGHAEWVYNGADIDGSTIVWARDMGSEKNRELIDYFSDRKTWLLEADEILPHLVPYEMAPAPMDAQIHVQGAAR